MANDKERRFRLRPRKPAARTERIPLASAYKAIMHYARMTSRRRRSGGQGSGRTRPHFQRCAVPVIYTKNSTRGQWRAHGRYVARESATHEGDPRAEGFNATEESIDIAARLEVWQKANDERLWKLIVSPEFGDRVDLKRLTRDLISQEGRILVHGEDEPSGRSYLILEGTGARLHYVYYTPEIEAARNRGELRTNSFVQLRKSSAEGRPALEIDDMGDSEAMLRNNRKLRQLGQRLILRGISPQDDGWGGWLGRYQKALRDAVTTLETPSVTKQSERSKNRDLGR